MPGFDQPERLSIADLGFGPPSFPKARVAEIALKLFGITGQQSDLGGERDHNTRFTTQDHQRYVLKISGEREDPATVDFQVRALLHIKGSDPDLNVPVPVRGLNGEYIQSFEDQGRTHKARLLSFMEGIPYNHGPFPSQTGLEGIGVFLARLDRALGGFEHPASGAFMPWDICNGRVFSPQFRSLIPATARDLCKSHLDRIEQRVYPRLGAIRKQVIHQDGHGGNLLRSGRDSEAVAGVIDFGDMVHGPLINEVTITASHFMEYGGDPFEIARSLCRGYCKLTPLAGEETDLLLDLVITRQILTLQLFEFRRLDLPSSPPQDNEEKPRVIRSLQRLSAIDRDAFNRAVREACIR